MEKSILTINGGSSSIKFALYARDDFRVPRLMGKIERIGLAGSTVSYEDSSGKVSSRDVVVPDNATAVTIFNALLQEHVDITTLFAVGHRVVHGMQRRDHARVTDELIAELKKNIAVDPEHLPLAIAIMEMFATHETHIPQVACFDTVFHRDLPRVATLFPLPRRFDRLGVRRYGFHGLSLQSLMEALHILDPVRAEGRVIVLHLGSGASITAINESKSVDTSMGFTPAGGIPMSTRSGDLDPGALLHIMEVEQYSLGELNHMINHESGLLGISETSPNMRDLLDHEATDERAKDAIDLFCYEAKKKIGAYVAVLGGVETLIFSGGMGENAPRIRTRICQGLESLGIVLDESRNQTNEAVISSPDSTACIRVMHTNEEQMIARITSDLIRV